MKKWIFQIILLLITVGIFGCTGSDMGNQTLTTEKESQFIERTAESEEMEIEDSEIANEELLFIEPAGSTLETRILTPEDYERKTAEEGSLLDFLRNYPVKEDGSPVLLYDGSEKRNQEAHIAILDLPIENADLQQCADSIMRMYAEYFLASGQLERISFHFTNGFEAPYMKWVEGYRIQVNGNDVSWIKSAEYDDSYEAFVKYIRVIFTYAGTLSMDAEAEEITIEKLQPGDVFIKGGSPGHVVMVVDICENEAGKKAYLLAQGYMPAQEFHVLKNHLRESDPWYYEEDITYPFLTPEYVFEEGSMQRLNY